MATITSNDMLQMFSLFLNNCMDTCSDISDQWSARFIGYLADFSLHIVLQFLYTTNIVSINSVFQLSPEEKSKGFTSCECCGHGFAVLCERYRPENVSSNHSSILLALCGVAPSCWYQMFFFVEGLVKISFLSKFRYRSAFTLAFSLSESSKQTRTNDSCGRHCSPNSDFVYIQRFFLIKIWFFRTLKAHVVYIYRCIQIHLCLV